MCNEVVKSDSQDKLSSTDDSQNKVAKYFKQESKRVPLNFLVPVEPPLVPFYKCIGVQWNELYLIPAAQRALIPVKGDLSPRTDSDASVLFSPRVKEVSIVRETDDGIRVVLTVAQLEEFQPVKEQ